MVLQFLAHKEGIDKGRLGGMGITKNDACDDKLSQYGSDMSYTSCLYQ